MTAFILALVLGWLGFELKAWWPRIVGAMVVAAVRQLPRRERGRFREEWLAHIGETPGAALKLWHCAGFFLASRRMFPRWRQGVHYRRKQRFIMRLSRFAVRTLDLMFTTSALVFLMPLLIVIAVAVKLESRGPVLFRQRGIGMYGQAFTIYRFRTTETGPTEGLGARPYGLGTTRLGRLLRLTSADKLPLLLNVVAGEMSLVGPRPSRGGFAGAGRKGLRAKPGITGLWPNRTQDREGDIAHLNWMTPKMYLRVLIVSIRDIFRR